MRLAGALAAQANGGILSQEENIPTTTSDTVQQLFISVGQEIG
jgi:hypothetical protein